MRSLMYRQRFRNGRRTCSLCRQGQPVQLSKTSGVLLPWGLLQVRTVAVTRLAGYGRGKNHESKTLALFCAFLPSLSGLHATIW